LHRHRRLCAGIALVAVLTLALMPTLARALAFAAASGGSSVWADICTPQGVARVSVTSDDGADAVPPLASPLDPCAYCILGSDGSAPMPAPGAPPPWPGTAAPPQQGIHAVLPGHGWRHADARAPPFLA
jgi:hypothetical protein